MLSLLLWVENLKQDIESGPAWRVAMVTFYAHSRCSRTICKRKAKGCLMRTSPACWFAVVLNMPNSEVLRFFDSVPHVVEASPNQKLFSLLLCSCFATNYYEL